ncbi:three-Cys-motif partner protein TcmP [uncultured Lutibacter sp.]|uniref:three-Cys-motif partner protein TcmP n=1 Tax=uncultured Lutibacter sp. TaxID=437739 RepID=UPI002617E4A7|nr:three-Cys-motif partner protein TcmP [uncultured Lutibacter sp.]
MKKNAFFEVQSDLTSAKIKIYEDYLEGYLPKLLMPFGRCIIIDLFCGSGKNGKHKGSPLVLLDKLKYILNSTPLKGNKEILIQILFNDQNTSNISKLEYELNNYKYDRDVIKITLKEETYEDYIDTLVKKLENNQSPKFIFLDPFTYSNVRMNDLINLMNLPKTEVLLFLPIFHSYRFASKEFKSEHKTRKFVEEFTIEGVNNYENIYDFTLSVKNRLKKDIGLKYVRPILIEGGGSKNSLFLLTKHRAGMLLMNKVATKNTIDGNSVKVKEQNLLSLFDESREEIESSFLSSYKKGLIEKLKLTPLTNKEIVDFTIEEGFLPKQAKKILSELYNNKKIVVIDKKGELINSKLQWNIAEKIKIHTSFKWSSY